MSEIYSIGRDPSCSIYINDPSNMVSRSHASIRVEGRRRFITDHSTNGTYRNGIRLSSNVETQYTKDDEILLGGIYRLEWNSIPKSGRVLWPAIFFPALIILIVLLVLGTIYMYPKFKGEEDAVVSVPAEEDSVIVTQQLDTVAATVVLEDKSTQPKKKVAKRPRHSPTTSESTVSKKNVKDYSDEDDRYDRDAL